MKTKKSKLKGKRKSRASKGVGFGVGKLLWLVGGGILFLFIVLVAVFYSGWQSAGKLSPVYARLPLPVAMIGNSQHLITSKQLLQDLNSVKKFYQSNNFASQGKRVDFSTKQGQLRLQVKKKDILNKLIEDQVIIILAQKKNISVTSQEVDKAVQDSLKKSGSSYQELILNLKSTYGWTLDDFKNEIVKNQLYAKKLFQWYGKNILTTKKYQRAKIVKEKIVQDSEGHDNFSEIAKKFSEGDSAKNDGNLDWMTEKQIIPEVLVGIQDLKKGEISDIIISPLGMHIVKVGDVRETKEVKGNKKEYQLQQIFIRGVSFIDWVQEAKKELPVKIFTGKYKWDRNKGEVVFSNQQLQQQEEKIRRKSEGDPSL